MSTQPSASGRVLVVDDDATNLELVERRLEVDGFSSVLVETGTDGLEKALSEPFDAVLLDLRLPDMNGLDVLEQLQQARPELPVLIMTAHGSEAIAVKALMAGAAGYLIKPISRKDLIDALRQALARHQARREHASEVAHLVADVVAEACQRHELELLLDALDEGVLLLDAQGKVGAVNRAAREQLRLAGRPTDFAQVVSQIEAVYDEQDRPVALDQGELATDAVEAEYRVRWRGGAEQVFHVTSKPFGPNAGWMVVFRDVTARRDRRLRLEALINQQAAEMAKVQAAGIARIEDAVESVERVKSSIIGTLSHELRTPLNFIVGFGSVLADGVVGELSPEQAAMVEKMLQGAERLTNVVEDLLDSAMLAAGMLEPALEPLDLPSLAAETTAAARPRADLADIRLVLDAAGPLEAQADRTFTRKVLRQLIDNALKFTLAGGTVTVRVEADPASGAPSIAVADTGIGIAPEQLSRLFDRFYQVENESTRRFGGTGMGLATAQGLAEAMGAHLTVSSTSGAGSTFRLVLAPTGGRP